MMSVIGEKLSFWTPVCKTTEEELSALDEDSFQKIFNIAEKYFDWGNTLAIYRKDDKSVEKEVTLVIDVPKYSSKAQEVFFKILLAVSYLTLIIPAIMLIAKAIFRSDTHEYKINDVIPLTDPEIDIATPENSNDNKWAIDKVRELMSQDKLSKVPFGALSGGLCWDLLEAIAIISREPNANIKALKDLASAIIETLDDYDKINEVTANQREISESVLCTLEELCGQTQNNDIMSVTELEKDIVINSSTVEHPNDKKAEKDEIAALVKKWISKGKISKVPFEAFSGGLCWDLLEGIANISREPGANKEALKDLANAIIKTLRDESKIDELRANQREISETVLCILEELCGQTQIFQFLKS